MNFWPRERFPFIPTVAAPIQFQPVPSPFNNPAWDMSQQVMANTFFPPNVPTNVPWVEPSIPPVPVEETKEERTSSPRRDREKSEDGGSRSRSSRSDDRHRDRSRRRRSRSRDRDDSPRDRRGKDRSGDRRESSSRRSREKDGRDDRRRDRSRSPYDRRSDRNDYDDSKRRKSNDTDSKFSLESAHYKNQTPNETIMIRGLAQHITENDIRQDILQCGLSPKDIRLIRKKETGVSRGFAFVEFNNTEEALCWMEMKQGSLMLQDMYRAVMQFSIAAADHSGNSNWQPVSDWDCPKCYAHNFKKRMTCFKCLDPRPGSAEASNSYNEVSPHPTTKIIMRNLDPLTNEEELMKELQNVGDFSVQSCFIARDTLTQLSKGVCYLELKNVLDAIKMHNELMAKPFIVHGKKITVNFCKLNPGKPIWPAEPKQQLTMADVPQLAEYSARMYAANPTQKASFLQYYTQLYTNQINQMSQIADVAKDTNSAAAVAHTAIQMAQTKKAVLAGAAASALSAAAALNASQVAKGYLTSAQLIGNTAVGEPDASQYSFDESSGYYFDPRTGLYYDSNTQYYFHSQDQVYLYWDNEKKCYMSANGKKTDDKKKDKDKPQDKVKVAKRIAKDMERWAKTLNQKKEVAKMTQTAIQQAQNAAKMSASADVAFSVLERKDALPSENIPLELEQQQQTALVASYGGGSDSEGEEHSSEDQFHTDWVKMACLLCKRQFPAKEALQRHQQLSDLHKQNLETWYRSRGLEPPAEKSSTPAATPAASSSGGYRDRARERRMKFGVPDVPKPSKFKEKFLKDQDEVSPYEEPTKAGIPSGNVGSKMLQKMGWSEGMGLGKMNQGRTDIVQAVQRVSTAGLGVSGSNLGVVGTAGSSYKENVKRAAMARFSEMKD